MCGKRLFGIAFFLLVPSFVYAGGIVPHIRLNKSVYLVGEPIWATLWVTNETDTTIRIMDAVEGVSEGLVTCVYSIQKATVFVSELI
ncbi:MAG: hypothetical protein AB1393_13515 [Candidatus Edwardsbacteria bacterium]